jgi:RHS repeat-associated protein
MAGSGSWNLGSNWSTGSVPGSADDVVINTASAATITYSSGGVTIHSLTTATDDTLSITGGTLNIAGNSTLSGPLTMTAGTLSAAGPTSPNASITVSVSGTTTISEADLEASNFATLSLPQLTTYSNPGGDTIFEATGAGSDLSLPALATIGAIQSDWTVDAAGGHVDLPALASIGTSQVPLKVSLTTNGAGSQIDLSALTSFSATGNPGINFDNSGTMLLGQLATLTGAVINVGGDTVSLPNLSDVNGDSLTASNTGTLTLAGVQTYANPGGDVQFDASGTSSTVNLPALTSFGTIQASLSIQALIGGQVNLNAVTTIGTAQSPLAVSMTIQNSGSTVNLTDLTSYVPVSGKTITISNNGSLQIGGNIATIAPSGTNATVNVPALPSGVPVTLQVSGTYTGGTIFNIGPQAQITLSGGTYAGGATFNIGQGAVVNLAGASPVTYGGTLAGTGGGTVALSAGTLDAALGGVTLDFSAGMFQWTGGAMSTVLGDVTNTGMINLTGDNKKTLSDDGTLDDFGAIIQTGMGNLQLHSGDSALVTTLQIESGGSYLLESDSGVTNGGPSQIVNAGIIQKTQGAGTSTLNPDGPLNNTGTIEADSGTINLAPASITQVSSGALTAGTWNALNGASLQFSANGTITSNQATLTLNGAGAAFVGLGSLASNAGSLAITGGAVFTVSGDFANSGTLTVGAGSTLNVAGNFANSETLNVQVGGAPGSGHFSQIIAGGSATLAGAYDLSVVNAYTPAVGQQYTTITFASATGNFTSFAGLSPYFTESLTATAQVLTAVASPVDLVLSNVNAPISASVGQAIAVTWQVTNQSNQLAPGPWQDSVYLSATPSITSTSVLLAAVPQTAGLAANGQYSGNWTGAVPALPPGPYFILVDTDSLYQAADTNRANNIEAATTGELQIAVPTLTLGTPLSDSFTGADEDRYYQVTVPTGGSLQFFLSSVVGSGGVALYASQGTLPTPFNYQYAVNAAAVASPTLTIPAAQPGTYYLLAHSIAGTAATSAFSLEAAQTSALAISALSKNPGSNYGNFTIEIDGAGLTPNATVTLTSINGINGHPFASTAQSIDFINSSQIFATFNLGTIDGEGAGFYRLTAAAGNSTATAPTLVNVENVWAAPAEVFPYPLVYPASVSISAPQFVRAGRTGSLVITYSNPNPFDIVAPLLVVSSTNAKVSFSTPDDPNNFVQQADILGVAPAGPAGILRSGQSGSVTVTLLDDDTINNDSLPVQAGEVEAGQIINWNFQEAADKPSTFSTAAWKVVFGNLTAGLGDTSDSYDAALAQAATYLGSVGETTAQVSDVGRLWSFLISQANASFPTASLDSTVDASLPTPGGLPLAIDRTFSSSIAGRYQQGIFGLGWTTSWQASLSADASGNVTIETGGSSAYFALQPNGAYLDIDGEYGTLTHSNGVFTFTDSSGTQYVFLANGDLNYVQDTNANRITLGYNGTGQLMSLTYANEAVATEPTEQLALSYNAQGFVSTVNDGAGDTWTYSYDTAGHLLSVTAPDNLTTSYNYDTSTNPDTVKALLSITNPDGSQQNFAYDPATGRLKGTFQTFAGLLAQVFDPITYSYPGQAEVVATDDNNNQTTVWFNDLGSVAQVEDPRGNISKYLYDNNGNLVDYTDAAGNLYQYHYDQNGNLTQSVNPLGQTVQMTYGRLSNLTSLTDADGNTTQYQYDAAGNLRSITYPDNTSQSFQYDPLGNMIDTVEQNGDPVGYQYNAQGLPTLETFADGTSQAFTYDGHGNLLTAETFDATDTITGTTTLTYNTANELTSVTYPNGQFLDFTCNAAGQRTQSKDQDGFIVNYAYDGLGRLAELTDGSGNLIVQYTYNNLDQLSEKQNGNGTYTTYTYDPAGNLSSEVNYANAAGTTINSSFTYTYNVLNEETSVTDAADNVTTYTYDATGQLISVGLPGGQTISYLYNAAGDRTAVVTNGIPTAYVSNADNEITQVGAATYTYDANGNLHTVTDASGTTTYDYNDLNQLVSITSPDGSVQSFQYSPLGFMVGTSATSGGNTSQTNYLVDPTGLGNVVASYNGNSLIADYVYGLGLVSQTGPSGTGYYDFDASGNTIGISASNGAYVNQYSYLPFGETTTIAAALPNSFTFGGQFGVVQIGSGQFAMRAREYMPVLGQFLSNDPIGLGGGDSNIRRYVGNAPTLGVDPSGLTFSTVADPDPNAYSQSDYNQLLDLQLQIRDDAETLNSYNGIGPGFPLGINALPYFIFYHTLKDYQDAIYDYNQLKAKARKPQPQPQPKPDNRNPIDKFFFPTAGAEELPPDPGSTKSDAEADPDNTDGEDPNALLGPAGFGAQAFINTTGNDSYTIEFENDGSAAAQDVTVTEQLDANLDWTTFQLGSFNFGPIKVTIPAGLTQYQTTVAYENTDGSSLNVAVDLDFNVQMGVLTVTFTSLDPLTGQAPAGVFDGFLPPDDGSGIGEGYVQYTVQPKVSLATGTTITQQASVVFDINAPIATNTVTNTIDSVAPTSSVNPLPADSLPSFPVSWSGLDDTGGSGIAFYNVYVSINGGAWQLWQSQTTQTSAIYDGQLGDTYAFYSVAQDNVGNLQAVDGNAQAQTQTAIIQTTISEPENTAKPSTESISTLLAGHYGDPDGSTNTKPGIAILATSGCGTWQYSADGSTWLSIGGVSQASALLLPGADSLRFVPASGWSGQAQLLFVAWDGSQGAAGKPFNIVNFGATTPFSSSAGQLAVTVESVPTWIGTGAHLAPITPGVYSTSNPTTPAGNSIASVFGSYFKDNNATVTVGVAVTAMTGTTSGVWQYSLTGSTMWTNFPAVSVTSALLLASSDQIRFVPKNNLVGTFSLSALAWDGSVGTHGTAKNPAKLSNTAFSATALIATETIAGPTWTATTGAALTPLLPGTYSTNNASTPAGNTIASVFGGFFQDANPNVSVGVAVVSLTGTTAGAWQYSTNDAVTWTKFPAVSTTAALLLSASDQIRFVPNNNIAGTMTLTAYAWDGSSGTPGASVNLRKTGGGGVTGYSTTTLTAAIAINQAPTFSVAAFSEPPVAVNAATSALTVASLLASAGYGDPDGKNLPQGIAITGAASSVGAGQYLLAGGKWKPLPNVSPSAALLLPSSASLRFMANSQIGTATLTFAGWDQTQGVAGQGFDITASGGATAFSSAPSTLSIAVQEAPSWSASAGALTALLPGSYSAANSMTPPGDTVHSIFGSFFHDANPTATVGIAVAGLTGNGAWQYSTNAGTGWTSFSTPSRTNALLLSANDLVRFVPKTSGVGTATLTAYAWDGSVGTPGMAVNITQQGAGGASAFSAKTLTAACVVNTAPTLATTSVTLSPVNENASSPAVTAATLLSKAGYADADGKSVPSGIAITSDVGQGTWQWLDGAVWTALPSVPANAAFLLPSASQVRFKPADDLPTNTNDSAMLTYLAWDQTAGTAGSIYSVAGQGGASAFSTTAATAAMTVNFVKHSPAWAAGVSASFTPVLALSPSNLMPSPAGDTVTAVFGSAFFDASEIPVGIAITALGGATVGVWQYSSDGGANWTNLPAVSTTNALLLPASAKLRFVPSKAFSGTITLTAYAWDGTGNFPGDIANLIKTGLGGASPFSSTGLAATCLVNSAPTLKA